MRKLFDPDKTYKTYKNAKKVIDGLVDGDYHWLVATTEDGRYFPVIFLQSYHNLNFHYFIHKGCCVRIL